jgi:hypothetical protein
LQQIAAANPGITNPKAAILAFFGQNGGEAIGPKPDCAIFFREPSLMAQCRRLMKLALPWAFSIGPETAAILGVPAGIPVAETIVVYQTERVKPDISESDFFFA